MWKRWFSFSCRVNRIRVYSESIHCSRYIWWIYINWTGIRVVKALKYFYFFRAGIDFWSQDFDVYRQQILMSKVNPCTEGVKYNSPIYFGQLASYMILFKVEKINQRWSIWSNNWFFIPKWTQLSQLLNDPTCQYINKQQIYLGWIDEVPIKNIFQLLTHSISNSSTCTLRHPTVQIFYGSSANMILQSIATYIMLI